MSKASPWAVGRPWKSWPYQEARPRWIGALSPALGAGTLPEAKKTIAMAIPMATLQTECRRLHCSRSGGSFTNRGSFVFFILHHFLTASYAGTLPDSAEPLGIQLPRRHDDRAHPHGRELAAQVLGAATVREGADLDPAPGAVRADGRLRVIAGELALQRERTLLFPESGHLHRVARRRAPVLDEEQLDRRRAGQDEPDLAGRPEGKVEDAAFAVRSAVVDPDHHRLAVANVADFQEGSEGKGGMGRGQLVHIEALAARRSSSVELETVPGRRSSLDRLRARAVGARLRPAVCRTGRDESAEGHQDDCGVRLKPGVHTCLAGHGVLRKVVGAIFVRALGPALKLLAPSVILAQPLHPSELCRCRIAGPMRLPTTRPCEKGIQNQR